MDSIEDLANNLISSANSKSNKQRAQAESAARKSDIKKNIDDIKKSMKSSGGGGGLFGKLTKSLSTLTKIVAVVAAVASIVATGGASAVAIMALSGVLLSAMAKPLSKTLGLGKAGEVAFGLAGAALSAASGNVSGLSGGLGALGKTGEIGADVASKLADVAKFAQQLNPQTYLDKLGLNSLVGDQLKNLGLDSVLGDALKQLGPGAVLSQGLSQLGVAPGVAGLLGDSPVGPLVEQGLKEALTKLPMNQVLQQLGVPDFTNPEAITKGLLQQGLQGWAGDFGAVQQGFGELGKSFQDLRSSFLGENPVSLTNVAHDTSALLGGIMG